MRDNTQQSLTWLLRHEGYISNDRFDPGGLTKWGIIQREYNAARKKWGKVAQSVRLMTWDEMVSIYVMNYFTVIHFDDLPNGIDNILLDMAVNSGPRAAIRLAQQVLISLGHHVTLDGVLGVETLGALHDIDPRAFIERFTNRHLVFFRGLRTWWRFGSGWKARILGRTGRGGVVVETGVLQESLSLIGNMASALADESTGANGGKIEAKPEIPATPLPFFSEPTSGSFAPLTAH